MNRKLMTLGCAAALVANSIVAVAQNPVPDKDKTVKRDIVISDNFTVQSDGNQLPDHFAFFNEAIPAHSLARLGGQDQQFGYVASRISLDGKVVKGHPYSADIVNEHTQTLGDGNRIVRRSTASVARDSEGRTRQESVVVAFGPLAEAMSELPKHITIYDPVTGTTYMLNPKDKTANKIQAITIRTDVKPSTNAAPKAETNPTAGTQRVSGGTLQATAIKKVQPPYPAVAKAAGAEGPVQVTVTVNENGDVTTAQAVSGSPLLRDAAVEAGKQWKFQQTEVNGKAVPTQGTLTFNFTLDGGPNKEMQEKIITELKAQGITEGVRMSTFNGQDVQVITMNKQDAKKESLGKQNIEGVECEGTRETSTIAAGAMGNEQPINIITESWYSPELQITVLRKFNDPRYGEDVYRLSNINRAEPNKDLFVVPADYTIKEGRSMMIEGQKMMLDDKIKMRMKEVEEHIQKRQN
ncbi:MAG: energy transducer TonB [Blastocatellia bacterium]